MRQAKLEEAKETLSGKTREEQLGFDKIKELENIMPDMPRFEGFFNSLNKGKHPFEEEEFNRAPEKSQEELESDLKYDEELYERELQGRLMGETLSPRQFGELYKAKLEGGDQVRFVKDSERKEFLHQRDVIRLIEEHQEAARRRQVMSGEWNEEESHARLKEEIRAAAKEAPSDFEHHKFMREYKQMFEMLWKV
jgi:hypothetical protein